MEIFYIIVLGILLLLAISDLVVGVSNDAVNFLNSAIGSKAAPYWVILVIASIGVAVGATFSSGMMEVARNSMFHPEMFVFSEIMIMFLAIMLADVLLLDLFNTLGLPTSTTVSIIFELLGAAVGVAIIKVMNDTTGALMVADFINSEKALGIVSAILVSVALAFTGGVIVQFLIRLIFTFNTAKTYKYFGAIWGAIAISGIFYYIVIKGLKGASFISKEEYTWIKDHSMIILGVIFSTSFIILQLLTLLTKVNILRIIILFGTFSLAMAFAGNDLVNFIGVPLAGISSWEAFTAAGSVSPDTFTMEILNESAKTPTTYLFLAGIVMVLTLWLSKKAKTVTETEVGLSRQDAGYERFGSTGLSRSIVRASVNGGKWMEAALPAGALRFINKRFAPVPNADNDAAFDMIRASVNLTVASILIALGTTLKLPLSTTYVTFMVAMGSSLSDGAWGRESAVYRVTGVISVIGGWFITALIAFTASLAIAMLLIWGGAWALVPVLALAVFIYIQSNILHKKREDKKPKEDVEQHDIYAGIKLNVVDSLHKNRVLINDTLSNVVIESLSGLKSNLRSAVVLNEQTSSLKSNIPLTIGKLKEEDIESGHHYVQVIDYLREMAKCGIYITKETYDYVDNNHPKLIEKQVEELQLLQTDINELMQDLAVLIETKDFSLESKISELQKKILEDIGTARKNQLKRIKKKLAGTRNSMMYLSILSESKYLLLYAANLMKAHNDFMNFKNK